MPRLITHRKRQDVDEVLELLKDIDRRDFVLHTLREALRPITTAECACACAFVRETGLQEDDARLEQTGSRFSLDYLPKANRVRRAGTVIAIFGSGGVAASCRHLRFSTTMASAHGRW